MSNKKCIVPEKSFKVSKTGYEEIHVPAPKPKPMDAKERLVPISSLPDWSQPAFAGIESLNRIQSRVYPKAMGSDENILMCAPTGAGKTNVALLSMLREIGKHHMADGQIDLEAFKIVYVAPMKALVQEMVQGFGKRLACYGISVAELTGDQQLTKAQIALTQVIVTTPEKWDVISRKGGDQSYTRLVRLIIIDEIHLLHDSRGPVLEALVARTLRQAEETQEWVRLVGLSATLPNYVDVGRFLRVDPKEGIFFFDGSYRPCPLAQQFIGINEKNAIKRQNIMSEIVYEKAIERAGKVQMIVFVHSRKDTAKTGKFIRDIAIQKETIATFLRESSSSRGILSEQAELCKSNDLKELLPYGFAIHHAGMTRQDRNMVEDLFAAGHIQVLISTATLAWGVNLPAHTVIIKGTQVYNPEQGRWAELSAQDTLQMLGRAGRPQYDVEGEGIIITSHNELQFYLSLLNQQLPIESQLMGKLLDHLNAEVVLGSVRTFKEALDWIGYTYLAVRMAREPALYGVPEGRDQRKRRADLIHAAAMQLDKANLIRYDRRTGLIQPTELGRIASHYYVGVASMAIYNEHLRPFMDDLDLFRVFSLSQEFKLIPVRREEKVELTKLAERIPIPIKESPDEPAAKINILLQAYISQLALEGFALASDMVYVTQSANRILRALFEMCLRRGWSRLAKKALNLCKMVDRRQWLSMTPLRQIKNGQLSSDVLRKLENKDFPFERLADLNPQELGELIRIPKLGKVLHSQVHLFPKVELSVNAVPLSRELMRMDLSLTPAFNWAHEVHGQVESFWILVEDVDEEHVLHVETFLLKERWATEEHFVSFTVPLLDPLPPAYFVSLISDRWIACETRLPVMINQIVIPDKPALATTLDLEEESPNLRNVYESIPGLSSYEPKVFNRIQSQVFPALFKSDENVLVAAPSGSGKTVCAEMAIARQLIKDPSSKIVFMHPQSAVLEAMCSRFQQCFGEMVPAASILLLSGESATDLKSLERGSLILATPQQWDLLSRKWKTRKNVQTVSLFIADDLHLMGSGEVGALIEAVLSRMRFISAHLEAQGRKVRIVALSTALANVKDIGSWLGVPAAALFNYDFDSRPSRLSIQIQGFTIAHHASSILAMTRPAFLAVKEASSAIVFVEDAKQAKVTASNLLALATADAVRNCAKEGKDLSPIWSHILSPKGIEDPLQVETLASGIGFLSAHDPSSKQIQTWFNEGRLHVLVVAKDALYDLFVTAQLVVLLGTQIFNGRDHRYVEYPIAEVHKMLGFAQNAPESGAVANALICCPSQRKAFYKNILSGPLPIESHLDQFLADQFNAEIVAGTIRSKQDAVDYLTWTYLYRRLAQNPNYYGMQDRSARHISEHLSQVVEQSVEELKASQCVEIEADEVTITPLNLGIISAYYSVYHLTVEMFAMSLTATTKLRGILEIISASSEFDSLPMRHGEEKILSMIYEKCPVKQTSMAIKWHDPHVKALILLQAHFSRLTLPADLEHDQKQVITKAITLIQAMVDVISSHGWLNPALAAMEFSQMLVQAQWDYESPLKQLPYFSSAVMQRCKDAQIESVFDLIDDEEKRNSILPLFRPDQKSRIAESLNKYPNVQVELNLNSEEVALGDQVILSGVLIRDTAETVDVVAPHFPSCKDEAWWIVIGNPSEKLLLGIKRIAPKPGQSNIIYNVEFAAPPSGGSYSLKAYLISDCWIGCDQEFDLDLHVA